MEFSWYELCAKEDVTLQQGDFILDCPIVIPPEQVNEGDTVDISVQKIDSIVLSQSCDLLNNKLDIVLVCPYYSLSYCLESILVVNPSKRSKRRAVDNLRKGYLPAYHLLNKYDEYDLLEDYQVVDFRNVYGVHFNVLKSIITSADNRIRLLPPYKEHLSQAFARYFMRVGLPNDIIVENSYY